MALTSVERLRQLISSGLRSSLPAHCIDERTFDNNDTCDVAGRIIESSKHW